MKNFTILNVSGTEIALERCRKKSYPAPMSRKTLTVNLFALFFAPFFCGCVSDDPRFGMPNLLHPGHIDEQRARMERFDPFPQVGMGPNVDGGRFHGADVPKPPVEHLKDYYDRGY